MKKYRIVREDAYGTTRFYAERTRWFGLLWINVWDGPFGMSIPYDSMAEALEDIRKYRLGIVRTITTVS